MSSAFPFEGSNPTLRDDLNALENMERENINLKMKLFHLEQQMRASSSSSAAAMTTTATADDSVQTIHDFARRLEEKSLEVDQRNQLLSRAKSAIEALKGELERQRADAKVRTEELETQLRQVKLANDEITYKYHERVLDLEERLEGREKALAEAEQARAQAQHSAEKSKERVGEHARRERELEFKVEEARAAGLAQLAAAQVRCVALRCESIGLVGLEASTAQGTVVLPPR
jgi:uncharacterized protein (DUF3084 family)